jgi:hypothetical protein
MHVPGLALTFPELTVAHTQMLLPVPMEGLCPSLAFAIGLCDALKQGKRTYVFITTPEEPRFSVR